MNREIAPSFSTGQPICKAGIDLALFDLTGATAEVGKPYSVGEQAFVEWKNAQGGVAGRPIDLDGTASADGAPYTRTPCSSVNFPAAMRLSGPVEN